MSGGCVAQLLILFHEGYRFTFITYSKIKRKINQFLHASWVEKYFLVLRKNDLMTLSDYLVTSKSWITISENINKAPDLSSINPNPNRKLSLQNGQVKSFQYKVIILLQQICSKINSATRSQYGSVYHSHLKKTLKDFPIPPYLSPFFTPLYQARQKHFQNVAIQKTIYRQISF